MSKRISLQQVFFACICILVGVSSASAQSDQYGDSLRVWAPIGASDADIGRLFDAHFSPVRGVAFDGQPTASETADTYREHEDSVSAAEMRAHARFPAVGGSVSLRAGESFGYIRAVSVRRVVRVPPTVAIRPVPGAAYFVSEIHYGFAYEMRIEGSSLNVAAAVNGLVAGVRASAAEASVRVSGATRGLSPRGDMISAMSALSPEQILERFTADETPRALFFKLERLPTDARSVVPEVTLDENVSAATPSTYEIHALSIGFPPRNNARNAGWDPIGGPDMVVDIYSGSRMVRRIAAARDAYSYEFGSAPFGEYLAVSTEQPLRFVFYDADMSSHDSAGEAQVTRLSDGDVRITTPFGAQLMIRVRTITP